MQTSMFPDKEGNASENKFILEELDLLSLLIATCIVNKLYKGK